MLKAGISALVILFLSKGTYGQIITPLMSQDLESPALNITATVLDLTFPPGDLGSPPHNHSGPVVGYVIEGNFLFQLKGGIIQIIPAGSTFHEKDHAIHLWGANASNTTTCKVVVTVWGRPGEPLLTFLPDEQRTGREEAIASVVNKPQDLNAVSPKPTKRPLGPLGSFLQSVLHPNP